MKFLKKLNLTVVVFCVCCIAFVAFLAYNPSHAYFEVHKDAIGVNTAKVDLLFDKYDESVFTLENNEDSLAEEDQTYKGPELNQNAEWGTEANPYIIRKKNHINNLAMLQKAGYFADKSGQSFFVVCDLVGKPVAINCSDDSKMEIAPIGTPSNPFTGNISGAYISGTATYGSYSVSQSTIANLQVVAVESTPDIGFFGTLGFVGEDTEPEHSTDANVDDVPGTLDGFAASVTNLLFADISIIAKEQAVDDSTWWSSLFPDHTHYADDHNETHHVGIVAGHAEWATIKDVSVYYTPSTSDATQAEISAFSLGGTDTNYYSVLGIVGTLKYVNPSTTTVGTGDAAKEVFSTKSSVSDEDLELTGGGGSISGDLTGYMLAKNIFEKKGDTDITLLEYYDEAYDVRDIKKPNSTEPLFEYDDVEEKSGALWWQTSVTYRYYYFRDNIFTFAMSAKGEIAEDGSAKPVDGLTDYIVQIWDPSSTPSPIKLSTSGDVADWNQSTLTGKSQYLYKLTPHTGSLTSGNNYVLAYQAADGNLYAFNLSADTSGYVKAIPITNETVNGTNYQVSYMSTNGNYTVYNSASEAIHSTKEEAGDANGDGTVEEGETVTVIDKIYGAPVISGYTPSLSGYIVKVLNSDGTYSPLTITDTGTSVYYFEVETGFNDEGELITTYTAATGKSGNTVTYVDLATVIENKGLEEDEYQLEEVHLAVNQMYIVGSENADFAFKYNPKRNPEDTAYPSGNNIVTFSDLTNTNYFGLKASEASRYEEAELSNIGKTSPKISGNNVTSTGDAFWANWGISQINSQKLPSNSVSVSGNITLSYTLIYVIYNPTYESTFYVSILYDTASNTFIPKFSETASEVEATGNLTSNLLLFKLENVQSNNANVVIPAQTYVPDPTEASLDPSKYVFFSNRNSYLMNEETGEPVLDDEGNMIPLPEKSYTLKTLEQLGWNDGNAGLLTQLNHAVKLAQATTGNFQLSFQDLTNSEGINDLLDSWFGQNNGGVVPAPVGTEGTYYTIPAGMIAFDIRKASADDPSYINIVVAINPDQAASSIGVYGPMSNGLTSNFNLNNPNDYFPLPISRYGRNESDFNNYKIQVTSYYTKDTVDGKTTFTPHNDGYYAFLGNEIALVAYSFEVTTPGVYLLGSQSGPMTVAYFSVDGAAGSGNDGTGNLPLGYVDFVYDNGAEILTVNKREEGSHVVANEDVSTYYYPSYQYVRLIPDAKYVDQDESDTLNGKIPIEDIFIRRFINGTPTADHNADIKRFISMKRKDQDTTFMLVSSVYADNPSLTLTQ